MSFLADSDSPISLVHTLLIYCARYLSLKWLQGLIDTQRPQSLCSQTSIIACTWVIPIYLALEVIYWSCRATLLRHWRPTITRWHSKGIDLCVIAAWRDKIAGLEFVQIPASGLLYHLTTLGIREYDTLAPLKIRINFLAFSMLSAFAGHCWCYTANLIAAHSHKLMP